MAEKTKASWADEIDELDQNESEPVTYEKEYTQKPEEDDRIESEDRPRRERRERNNRDREPREPREQREPLPFPDSPPFTAFVGNLPYNIYRDEIQKFFEERGCKVQNVRLLMNKDTNKPKGFGYVIFEELEDLKKAVGLSGQELLERPLRIDVAEARAEDANKPKRDSNRGFTRVGGSNNRYNNSRSTSYESPEGSRRDDKERPRIELKPRSTASNEDVSNDSTSYKSNKENPFGGAKPRDETVALKQIQERRSKEDVTSPSNEEDKSRDRSVRRDNNNSSSRGGRREGNNRPNNSGRKYDDKEKFKNNKDSRNRDDKSSRPPRAPREEFKSEPKTQISRNPFEGLAEEDD